MDMDNGGKIVYRTRLGYEIAVEELERKVSALEKERDNVKRWIKLIVPVVVGSIGVNIPVVVELLGIAI